MPRQPSRPLGRGSAPGGGEDLTAPEDFPPGWDGTIDPRLLSSPESPVATTAYSYYAPPPSSTYAHYQNYHSTNFDSEGDIEEYTTTSPNFANYTSVSLDSGFDAVTGQSQDLYPDNSGYDASGIDISHNTQLESFTTYHPEL
jgi:hypothetical protein